MADLKLGSIHLWMTYSNIWQVCTKRDRRAGLNQQGPVSLWKYLHKRSMTRFVSIGSKYGVRRENVQLKYEAVTKITLASSAKRS